ncbi:MAG: hypothetical protein IT221_10755, partial [Fluviicola sp.]|nr:hypothetical protein [Fluviicola sp.]
YHRCKALTALGYEVHLHCFEYGRGRNHDITGIAHKIYYYDRPKNFRFALRWRPFIVETRRSLALLERLKEDDFPILWEGQHCTAFLGHPDLVNHRQVVRVHNIEWEYYRRLAKRKGSISDRLFFLTEAWKLKSYDAVLKKAYALICVSSEDQKHYQAWHPRVDLLRSGFDLTFSERSSTAEDYAIFHGNLSVNENEEAVNWILDVVEEFKISRKIIISGKTPSESLKARITAFSTVELIENPNQAHMNLLIANAADQLLVTFQAAGLKLKLLISSATNSRCIATPELVVGSGLEAGCELVHSKAEFAEKIMHPQQAKEEQINQRHAILREQFDVSNTVKRLADRLFEEEKSR